MSSRATGMKAAKTASVSARILEILEEAGVDRVFGISGGAISRLYAEIARRGTLQIINAAHESSAVFLAMGYALATGRPAVALVTAGPGLTNALTGLASASADGIPVLLLAGEVPRASFGRGAVQEGSAYGINVVGMVQSVCKFARQIDLPSIASAVTRRALATMMGGRQGPGFLSLPLDVSMAEVKQSRSAGSVQVSFRIDERACREVGSLLAQAQRPLLLVGAGARAGKSRTAVAKLAHEFAVPVAVTPKGKGTFPEDDPLYLGVFGHGGHESVIGYLNDKPDVIVVCGSSLNDFATNAWSPVLTASEAFIQLDIEQSQIGKNYPVDLGLLGPLDEVISHIMRDHPQVRARAPHRGLITQPLPRSPLGKLSTAEVVEGMNQGCPADAVITCDMGEHMGYALHFLRIGPQARFLSCLGFGSMGSGIGTAIGHAIGAPERRAFALCGDGGFLMYGNELQAAVKHQAPVTFLIINDGRHNMCVHGMRDLYGLTPDCTLGAVEFWRMAEAFGAGAALVHTAAELRQGLALRGGPVVLDIRVDPDVRMSENARVAGLRQFTGGGLPIPLEN